MSRGKRRDLLALVQSRLCMRRKTRERQVFYHLCWPCERRDWSAWVWGPP